MALATSSGNLAPEFASLPALVHREAGGDQEDWRLLSQSAGHAAEGASVVTVVYCPTQQALKWALPWGTLPGPLSEEETELQAQLQADKHAALEAELGVQVDGYVSHVIGELRRGSTFLHLVELPDSVSSKIWLGSVLLRQLLLSRIQWPGKTVLELGSGVGLVGIAVAAAGAACVLTDLTEAMPLLAANVQRNGALVSSLGGSARGVELDWLWSEGQQRTALSLERVDLVIGSDVVYTVEAALGLLRTAFRFSDELWLLQNTGRMATGPFLEACELARLRVHREPLEGLYELWRIVREGGGAAAEL